MNQKTLGLCALALLAGCSLFTQRPPVNPEQEIAQAFATAFKQDGVAAALLTEPLPAETLTTSQISVVIEGHFGKARTRDGGWIVHVPQTGARILEYSTSDGSAGAVLNLRGNANVEIQNQNLSMPQNVTTRDALIVASTYNSSQGREQYWSAPGRSAVDEMMAVVFVPYVAQPNLLRPPAVGNNWLARFFRGHPIPEAAVDVARLPSVIDIEAMGINWQLWGHQRPSIQYLTGMLGAFGGDCFDGWSTDTKTPDFQHPGYGSYYSGVVSQALVSLCSTDSDEDKRPLAIAVAQRGLDLVGVFADGRYNYPNGGHAQGRKALLIMCGYLLKVRPFEDPNRFIGLKFQEDGAFRAGTWWFGGGWDAVWGFKTNPPFNGEGFATPPSTWGDPHSPTHSTFAWTTAYMNQVCGSQVGTAVAMHLCGLGDEMGVSYMRMITQWMEGPPQSAINELAAAGIEYAWGTDYGPDRGRTFCSTAWQLYHDN